MVRNTQLNTLLNLGRHFAVAQEDWPSLCPRIEEILTGQAGLLPLKPALEKFAQRMQMQVHEKNAWMLRSLLET